MESTPAEAPTNEPKPSRIAWLVAVVLIAAGMVSAGVLLVDYTRPLPTFCDEGGGCLALRQKTPQFAYPFGIPMPLIGLVAWLGQAIVWNVTAAYGKWARLVWCVGCGAVGAGLIAVQFREGKFCAFCLVTDVSSVVLMAMSVLTKPLAPKRVIGRALVMLALAFVGIGTAWGGYRMPQKLPPPAPVPAPIREELSRAPQGTIVVIDFADFECPFCRMNHGGLMTALADSGVKTKLVRKHVPLDRMHPMAHDAARVAICGDVLGRGEEVAEALFATEDLALPAIQKLAVSKGCDEQKLAACLADSATEDRIKADTELFNATKTAQDGLPLMWIGDRKFVGVQDPKVLSAALRAAK